MTQDGDRKWVIGLVKEGAKGQYWAVLRGQIEDWLRDEHRRLDLFKKLGMHGAGDQEKYNRAVDRIEYLQMMLRINESIIEHNESILRRVKDVGTGLYKSCESFVKEFRNA